EGGRLLAVAGMGGRDDGGLEHRRMRADGLLDVAGRELLPTPVDHILEPPGDVDDPFGAERAEVASTEPAVTVERRSGVLLAQVPEARWGPRTRNSPTVPGATSAPPSSMTRISQPGATYPSVRTRI